MNFFNKSFFSKIKTSHLIITNFGLFNRETKRNKIKLNSSKIISNLDNLISMEYSLDNFHRSNQDTCLVHKPSVFEGQWVQSGDLLADCSASVGGELALGQNILIAYMPWEGYNFEDAILISERLVYDDLYTSIHIERYEIDIRKTKLGMEEITREIPDVSEESIRHLHRSGIAKLGSWIQEGDILVGKVTPINKKNQSNYQKLLYTILEKPVLPVRDSSLRAPKGIKAKIVGIQIFKNNKDKMVSNKQKSSVKNIKKENSQLLKKNVSRSVIASPIKNKNAYLNNILNMPLDNKKQKDKSIEKINNGFSTGTLKTPINLKKKFLKISNQTETFIFQNNNEIKNFSYNSFSLTKINNPKTIQHNGILIKNTIFQKSFEISNETKTSCIKNSFFTYLESHNEKNNIYPEKIQKKLFPNTDLNNKYYLRKNQLTLKSQSRFKKEPRFFFNSYQNKNLYKKDHKQLSNNPQNVKQKNVLNGISSVQIYLAEKRRIQVGDKMAGRHGNKGIISQILPPEDMPFLPDGTPLDMVLNPLGVPSRMNVGQIYECLLGLAGKHLGENFKVFPFDEIYGAEASRNFVYSKLYNARMKTGKNWLFNPNSPGKICLYDGRTGESFNQAITVGYAYMLRLVHMVDDKIHARSTGPYSLVTQQPLRGRSKQGGQRLGEMEVWALEGYGAAFTLLEMLTIKSDDMTGRMTLWSNLILNKEISIGTPESFKVLICELQALCLDIGLFRTNGKK